MLHVASAPPLPPGSGLPALPFAFGSPRLAVSRWLGGPAELPSPGGDSPTSSKNEPADPSSPSLERKCTVDFLSAFLYDRLVSFPLDSENLERGRMTDKWLTVKEVADYLKLSTDLIYKFAQQGKIPVSKIGNQWRFDREEIDTWVKAQRPRVRAKRRG